jgi:tRNA(fMet)-specific endonuclease VapC
LAYMIDTDVAIHLRDGDPVVSAKFADLGGGIVLSVITRVELEGGVYRDPSLAAIRRPRLDAMLSSFPVLDFDALSAEAYRQIVSIAGYSRRKSLDRMIAAQAIAHRVHLVTMNAPDFRDIPGLSLVEWNFCGH